MTESAKPKRGTLLVTGGGRGIGRAVAELAAQRNWAVAVNYRQNAIAAEAVVQAISERGAHALAIQGDVSSEADVVRVFDVAEQRLGAVTAVVNNAGIVAPVMPLAEASADRFRRLLDVNVYGALLVAREAARRLSTARGGSGGAIVNVSSIAARLGSPGEYVDYAATKAAIDTLTIGLGRELAREGVRVNAVRPGLIETDIHADSGAADRAQRLVSCLHDSRRKSRGPASTRPRDFRAQASLLRLGKRCLFVWRIKIHHTRQTYADGTCRPGMGGRTSHCLVAER